MIKLNDGLKYQYYKNCSVLLEVDGKKVLCDGIVSDRNPFDRMPDAAEAGIMDREGEFEDLETLVFTHCHNDHFSGFKLTKFLERNHGAYVAVPASARLDWDYLWDLGANVCPLKGAVGEVREWNLGGVELEFMKTGHLTFNYPEHYVFNIIGKDSNVLLTSDMDLQRLDLLEKFTVREHSYLFISNIVCWHRKWREAVDRMGFERVFVYHIPDGENDPYGYRARAVRFWRKQGAELKGWEPLNLDEDVLDIREEYK